MSETLKARLIEARERVLSGLWRDVDREQVDFALRDALHAIQRPTEPTPESLEAWADFFGPKPWLWVLLDHTSYDAGYLLREIALRLRAAREE